MHLQVIREAYKRAANKRKADWRLKASKPRTTPQENIEYMEGMLKFAHDEEAAEAAEAAETAEAAEAAELLLRLLRPQNRISQPLMLPLPPL